MEAQRKWKVTIDEWIPSDRRWVIYRLYDALCLCCLDLNGSETTHNSSGTGSRRRASKPDAMLQGGILAQKERCLLQYQL